MEYDHPLDLTADEISSAMAGADGAERYPAILTLAQAAELAQVPLGTIRDWRSRGLLAGCSSRPGKQVRIWRDRFIQFLFSKHSDATKESKRKVCTRWRDRLDLPPRRVEEMVCLLACEWPSLA